jgi:hypothetical protein
MNYTKLCLLWVVLVDCGSGAAPSEGASRTTEQDTACVVARLGAHTITIGEVATLRAGMAPPPAQDEASRLLVDLYLAQHIVDGSITTLHPRARFEHYHRWHASLMEDEQDPTTRAKLALSQLEQARQAVQYTPGPCASDAL